MKNHLGFVILKSTMTITIQYLEPNAETLVVSPQKAQAKLQAAFDRLPIDAVLLGWSLPESLVTAVSTTTHANNAKLYRWHPLLTGDGEFIPRPEWQTVGISGERVPGFRGMPEFTFVCPNKTAVRTTILQHLQTLSHSGLYDGIFLDRMRFPSPAADPGRWLACFCEDCQRAAKKEGLDLTAVRQEFSSTLSQPNGARLILQDLAGFPKPPRSALRDFLAFRTHTITQFITEAAAIIRGAGLAVGLDCFAPSLTHMVGQDLAALAPLGDWVKVMTYAHTLGPAGLPYELLDLANWLITHGTSEQQALTWLSETLKLPLPEDFATLRNPGLSTTALQAELRRGKTAVSTGSTSTESVADVVSLLAGIELIKLEGVTHLSPTQITRDLTALHDIQVDGLSLSWDLHHMPLTHLDLVAEIFKP